ncbi:MAG: ABC transporter ATP-binding protein [bacterium]
MFKVQGLSKCFAEKKVLDQIDLTVNKGETTVIMGSSGCGKSTFLRHLNGLLRPDSGRIFFAGQDVTELTEAEWNELRCNIGMVFQNAALFDSLPVWENVAFGLKYHTSLSEAEQREIALEKLALVGLDGSADLFPAELSGGMQKRVSLARAIALNPEVVLYDEPTSGLDPIMTHIIDNLILKLKKELQITSVVVTHDVASAMRIADRIVMFAHGQVLAAGTPEEITASNLPAVRNFLHGELEGERGC